MDFIPPATVIDGKAFARRLFEDVAKDVKAAASKGLTPGLAVILVGDDPASAVYVRSKGEQTQAAGMYSETHRLSGETAQSELEALVRSLNDNAKIHGILVQLPLPAHLDSAAVIAAIDPDKDVDGLSVVNAGRLASDLPALTPCTPLGCMLLLKDVLNDLSGLRAVVVGRSNLMGKPMAQLLLKADCTVTIAHSKTLDLPAVCREADILVAAVGRPQMVKADWIKPGAVVIDVGINRVASKDPAKAAEGKTRLVGDVDFDSVRGVARAITPVPGGVGPMTIACLLRNTLTAAQRQGLATP